MPPEVDLQVLQNDVSRPLAVALQTDIDHAEAAKRAAAAHEAQIDDLVAAAHRTAQADIAEDARLRSSHAVAARELRAKAESLELIGQARGVLVVAMRCTAEQALAVLTKQSETENRPMSEIAAEIVRRAECRARPLPD